MNHAHEDHSDEQFCSIRSRLPQDIDGKELDQAGYNCGSGVAAELWRAAEAIE